ncbi:MAG: polysaccharide biosynthesis tyrosine autokinase [Prevotellaceae bacterium]|jgi:capsular exopolysaccharide synthesis family protein|nr:polysaccharide biosynthesis tyrosine autokinase [Prevotellaceae bacterium]
MENQYTKKAVAQRTEKIDLRKIIQKYLRHWYWFLISVAVCLLIGFLFLKTQPFKFQVKASILLRQSEKIAPADELGMLEAIGFTNSEKEVDDEIEILSSKALMMQVIDTLGIKTEYYQKLGWQYQELYKATPFVLIGETPDFNDNLPATVTFSIKKKGNGFKIKIDNHSQKQTVNIDHITDTFNTFSGKFHLELTGKVFDESQSYRIVAYRTIDLLNMCNGSVKVIASNKKANAINITTVTSCIEKAQDMLNMLVDFYNEDAIRDKNLMAQTLKIFLDKRIKLIENELFSVEKNEEEYKKINNLTDLKNDAKLYLELASDYEKQRVNFQSQLGMLTYLEEWVKDEKNSDGLIPTGLNSFGGENLTKTKIPMSDNEKFSSPEALMPAGASVNSGTLNALIKEYNDILLQQMKLPRAANDKNSATSQYDQQLKLLRSNILSSVSGVKKGIQISLNEVAAKDNQFKSKIQNVPTQTREIRVLSRQQDIKETLYLFLLQKQEEMELSLASTLPAAKSLDYANTSPIPVSPRVMFLMLVALIAGMSFPMMFLYLKELFYNKVQDKDELKKKVPAPLLGSINQCAGTEKLVVRENARSAIAEQFRLLRANLQFLLGAKEKQSTVLCVTSTTAGEGKTFVAINTAMALALTKKKTVLLDLDIRNPKLSHYLNIPNANGVSSFLAAENRKIEDSIYRTPSTGELDIIPCGTVPSNPAELLTSEQLDTLFEQLRKKYDYIVVDTAPVGIVADALVINKNADVNIYVVRAKYTSKDALTAVKELYESKKLNNLALVLNGADERNTRGYEKYYKGN